MTRRETSMAPAPTFTEVQIRREVDTLHQFLTAAGLVVYKALEVKNQNGRQLFQRRLARGFDLLARLGANVPRQRFLAHQALERFAHRVHFFTLKSLQVKTVSYVQHTKVLPVRSKLLVGEQSKNRPRKRGRFNSRSPCGVQPEQFLALEQRRKHPAGRQFLYHKRNATRRLDRASEAAD